MTITVKMLLYFQLELLEDEIVELSVKSITKLKASVIPENAVNKTIYYTTDNSDVVMVDDTGTIIAINEGAATVSAITSDGGYVANCLVIVNKDNNNLDYHIDNSMISLNKGNKQTLSIKNADGEEVSDVIEWTSINPDIATVNSLGELMAVSAGSTYIIANIGDDYTDYCMVTVIDLELQAILFGQESLQLTEGEEINLDVNFVPSNTVTSKEIKWDTSDKTIATISQEGVVTAVRKGQVVITATSLNGKVAQCKIIVNELPRYTIIFDSDLGNDPIEVNDILGGSTIVLPPDPEKDGLIFMGWFTEKDGKGEMISEYTIIEENLIVYAYWISVLECPDGLRVTNIIPQTYTGRAIKPIFDVYDGTTLLKVGIDYTVSYKNNIKVNDASEKLKAPTIIIKGKGNYFGSVKTTFVIQPKRLEDEDIIIDNIIVGNTNKLQKPVPIVFREGKKLKNKKDFIVEYPDMEEGAYKLPGTYTICIKAKQNSGYIGERKVDLTILPEDCIPVSKLTIAKIPSQDYKKGTPSKPALVVKYKGKLLQEGKDYKVEYENNKQAGIAKAILTGLSGGKEIYVGTRTVTFKIKGTPISKAIVNYDKKVEYNGNAHMPKIKLMNENGTKTLIENTDYTITYGENINVGKGTIIIQGMGAYSGTIKKTFTIEAYDINQSRICVENANELTASYNKTGAKPMIKIFFGERELEFGIDYTLSYKNNKKLNSNDNNNLPQVIIKGKRNFKGKLSLAFKIIPKDISDSENPISITAPDVLFNTKGNYRTKLTVKDSDGKKLIEKKDYLIEEYVLNDGSNKILLDKTELDVGTEIKVKVKGINNYCGMTEVVYKVAQKDISKINIKIASQEYTGKYITFNEQDFFNLDVIKVSGKKGESIPIYGTDYIIMNYENNKEKGIAKVTLKGISNIWGGTKTVTFRITSKKMKWFWDLIF